MISLNKKIIIVIVAVSLFAVGQYLVIENWFYEINNKMTKTYQEGYDKGIKDSVTALYQQTSGCKSTTIWIGNLTRNIIDLGCTQLKSNP